MKKLMTFAAIAALSTFATSAHAGSFGGHCAAPAPICAPTYFQHSGQYVTQTHSYWTQAPVTIQPVQRWSNCGGASSCNLTLAGPPLKSHDYYRGVTYTEHMPIARATREVVRGDCPAGTTYQADGTCLQPGIISGSSYSSYSSSDYSTSGSTYSGGTVWTGGSEHFNESTGRYEHGWRNKHKHKAHHHKHKAHKVKRGCHSRKSHTVYDYESASRCN